jgi:hypothetical protein
MGASVNYKVKVIHTKTIVVQAYNSEDAVEIASQIRFSNPEWDAEEEWSAEPDYEEDE